MGVKTSWVIALFIFAQSALASEVAITVYPTLGGAGVAISGGKKTTKERSAILAISSTGLLMWAVGKGIADAHAHYVKLENIQQNAM